MLLTVFVFVGIEGASVYSRYARDRNDVGIATVLGFLGVLCLLMLVTLLSYGILPRADLVIRIDVQTDGARQVQLLANTPAGAELLGATAG
jgi:amino acid transporter